MSATDICASIAGSSIEKYISPLIASQFPAVYREEGPAFVAFVKAFFEYLEQEDAVVGKSRRLLEYGDIDSTLTKFIPSFLAKYAPQIPTDVAGCRRMLVKHADELYSSKGTDAGLQLLFRIVYNEAASVRVPGDAILKVSDGSWVTPRFLEITESNLAPLLIGETITGAQSKASAIVEDFVRKKVGSKTVYQIFLSNIKGDFINGERLICRAVYEPETGPIIVGPMTRLSVVSSGLDYKVGDRLRAIDGTGRGAAAVVTRIGSRAGAITYELIDGGSGYTLDATVTVTQTGNTAPALVEAQGRVASLSNTTPFLLGNDVVGGYASVLLNAASYGFPKLPEGNVNTMPEAVLDTRLVEMGTIASLIFAPPGSGYSANVSISVVDEQIAPYQLVDPDRGNTILGTNAVVRGDIQIGTGVIEELRVIDSGIGYLDSESISIQRTTPSRPDAVLVQVHTEKQGFHEGYWRDTNSFLNSNRFIADNDYYQEFSYEVQTSMSLNRYAELLRQLWHPSGLKMFGTVVLYQPIDATIDIASQPIQQVTA